MGQVLAGPPRRGRAEITAKKIAWRLAEAYEQRAGTFEHPAPALKSWTVPGIHCKHKLKAAGPAKARDICLNGGERTPAEPLQVRGNLQRAMHLSGLGNVITFFNQILSTGGPFEVSFRDVQEYSTP